MLNFTVITIFPGIFSSFLSHSILKKAQEKGLISVRAIDLRDYATDRHRITDDYPYGGGQGMVMKPEPLVAAIEDMRRQLNQPRMILLAPQGRVFNQAEASRLAREKELVLICGRYEGVDERVKKFVDEELSIGDYTLSGGELAAMVVIEAVARLIPGVLGNIKSPEEESFTDGLLEHPQFTRPEEFRGMRVPEVLLSGDHQKIQRWRREMSLKLTRERRPDLLRRVELSSEERKLSLDPSARGPLGPSTQGREQAHGSGSTLSGSTELAKVKAERVDPKPALYLALLHHPVYDKNGQVVTTALTNMDIHDIARSARTYGASGFYVVTPVKAMQKLALKIVDHWERGYGSQYNATRKEALSLVRLKDKLDDAIMDVERECGSKPLLVATTAKPGRDRTSFAELRERLEKDNRPFLLLLGTGWGLTEVVLAQCDYVLEAIEGGSNYNHLSVRSAAAILLDRLSGKE